jgi:hypothetical protein
VRGSGFRARLIDRLGWSFGLAALWTWGLLGLRALRDGLPPLEVWFSYGLSFLMTTVYVYLGLLIVQTFRAERGGPESGPPSGKHRLSGLRRPIQVLGLAGLVLALVSVGAWLVLRHPGPAAYPGTVASFLLAGLILGVVVLATWLAWGVEHRPRTTAEPIGPDKR